MRKILIVEDNVDLQNILKISFETEWFKVAQSLDWLKWLIDMVEENPDIILLDVMMPEMDGFEVLNAIKNNSSYKNPIIVCSNMSYEQFVENPSSKYADLFLKKSDYDWEEIVEKVIEYLDNIKKEED